MAELEIDREYVHDRKKWRKNVMKRKYNPIGKQTYKPIIYLCTIQKFTDVQQDAIQIVSTTPASSNVGALFRCFGKPAMHTLWMAVIAAYNSGLLCGCSASCINIYQMQYKLY